MPRIFLDGEAVEAQAGDTVAAALLRARITTFSRSIKYHRPRGPFCFAGSCGQCLMRIDGVPSLVACRERVHEGMSCERQNAPLGAESDIFRATDFLFPEGLDHHHLLTGSRVLGRVALEVARRLAGLGELPDKVAPPVRAAARSEKLVIIGAGPAGLAAASKAPGALLVERDARVGGAALLEIEGPVALPQPACEVLLNAECIGLYPNDTPGPGNALAALRTQRGLLIIAAERVIVANGGAPQPLPFAGGDRPGVYAARGLVSLAVNHGVRVGQKLAVAGEGPERERCAKALERAGYETVIVEPVRALGNPVRAVQLANGEKLRCDAVAVAVGPAPVHELASSVGATARWSSAHSGFPVETDDEGRTAVPWLFAAGRVAGKPPIPSGEAAGAAACR